MRFAQRSRSKPVFVAILLTSTLAAAACSTTSSTETDPQPTAGAFADCPVPWRPPPPFAQARTTTLPGPTPHPTSTLFRDTQQRAIVVQSGALGDFFDDSFDARLPLSEGGHGYLYGRGASRYGFFWDVDEPCHQNSIDGVGFSEQGFVSLLVEGGLVAEGTGTKVTRS